MRGFVSGILNCFPVFWLLMVTGLILWKKKRKLSFYFLIAGLAWLALVTTTPLPDLLVKSLEKKYQPFLFSNPIDKDYPKIILVLGGGHTADPTIPENDQLSEGALKRLVEGLRIHRQIPASQIVMSGYARPGLPLSHAEVMAKVAMSLGVEEKAIETITSPKNTMEEALDFKARFGSGTQLILVTSAIHMPRAMMHFTNAELKPYPAPTHHLIKEVPGFKKKNWFPSSRNIRKVNAALHEYVGMLWGRVEWDRLRSKK